jgi:hypothetical protein
MKRDYILDTLLAFSTSAVDAWNRTEGSAKKREEARRSAQIQDTVNKNTWWNVFLLWKKIFLLI